MASNNNTISGLDINKLNICYAQCLLDDKSISNICIQPLDLDIDDYWESVSAGLDELYKGLKIPGEDVVASLPGEFAIIKKILLDNDEPDTASAIEWELSQQIVGSMDEYVYDYQSLTGGGTEEKCRHFLTVGYRNTAIERMSKLLRKKKITPLILDLDVFALINVFELNYKEKLSLPTLIIFSEIAKTKLILTCNGDFNDLEILEHADGEQSTDEFIQDLNGAIKKLTACNPALFKSGGLQTYLTGSGFYKSDFGEVIMENIKNAEMLFPFRKISCSAGMDEDKLKEFAPQLAVSVGLALRDID